MCCHKTNMNLKFYLKEINTRDDDVKGNDGDRKNHPGSVKMIINRVSEA